MDARLTGDIGEQLACSFLEERGFHIRACNVKYPAGEIDIIAENEDEVLFVEVKARHSSNPTGTGEELPPAKLERLQRAVDLYLQEYPADNWRPVLISIDFSSGVARARMVDL